MVENFVTGALEGSSPLMAELSRSRGETMRTLAPSLVKGIVGDEPDAAGMELARDCMASVPEADVRAMAIYVASLMPQATAEPVVARGGADPHAAAIFGGACGGCHGADAPMTRGGAPSLALSSAVS